MSNNDIVIRISTNATAAENLGVIAVLPQSTPAPQGKVVMAIVESAPTKA
ncbi:MAG: hypothetical protein ABSD42_03995 [Candidatus Bathyarchaeia archaeon]